MEWPPCITQACIPPEWLGTAIEGRAQEEGEKTLIELLLLQYVGVPMMRKQHEIRQAWIQASNNESHAYPFHQLVAPLPRKLLPTTTFREPTVSQRKWPDRFRFNLFRWLSELQWIDAPGQVMFLELALDFEAFSRRPISPAPEAKYERTGVLPLAERGRVLIMALAALQVLATTREVVPAKAVKKCKSLVPLGGPPVIGLSKRPYFTMRPPMLDHIEKMQQYYTSQWARNRQSKLRPPARPQKHNAPLIPMRLKNLNEPDAIKMSFGTNIVPSTQRQRRRPKRPTHVCSRLQAKHPEPINEGAIAEHPITRRHRNLAEHDRRMSGCYHCPI